ncbi:MAG: FeoB small GTPase domain-containing protein, partial [Phycisphaeraceae bacterium]
QITEITPRAVVCVNLVDEAKRKGIHVDVNRLSDQLGVPAVATAARRGEGLDQLASLISGVATGEIAPEPRLHETPAPLRDAVNRVLPMVRKLAPGLPSARWVAYRLLEGDEQIRSALATGELARIAEAFAPRPQAAPAPAPAPAIAGGGLP